MRRFRLRCHFHLVWACAFSRRKAIASELMVATVSRCSRLMLGPPITVIPSGSAYANASKCTQRTAVRSGSRIAVMNSRTLSRIEVGPSSKVKSRSISVRAKPLAIWALGVSFLRAIAGDITMELFRIGTRSNVHPSSSRKGYRLMSTKPGQSLRYEYV